MKIDVFVPTGEIRQLKLNDWYFCDNMWFQWINNNMSVESHPIGIWHQIEVPSNADAISISAICSNPVQYPQIAHFPIPRPKKKVKKWQWVLSCISSQEAFVPAGYYTEEGIKQAYPNRGYYHKVMETEIETDE